MNEISNNNIITHIRTDDRVIGGIFIRPCIFTLYEVL